jgi:DNA primase large subunit
LFAELRLLKINNEELKLEDTDSYRRYQILISDFERFLSHETEWKDEGQLFFFQFNYKFFKRYFRKQLEYMKRKIQQVFKYYNEMSSEELIRMVEEERLKRIFSKKPRKLNVL